MDTWLGMLFVNLLIPFIMILFGWWFSRHAPKEIHFLFGYRTTMSMKNQQTWQFAHHYCGRLWFLWGRIWLAVVVVCMVLLAGKTEETVETFGGVLSLIGCIPLAAVIVPTEMALRRTFDTDGNRKTEDKQEK